MIVLRCKARPLIGLEHLKIDRSTLTVTFLSDLFDSFSSELRSTVCISPYSMDLCAGNERSSYSTRINWVLKEVRTHFNMKRNGGKEKQLSTVPQRRKKTGMTLSPTLDWTKSKLRLIMIPTNPSKIQIPWKAQNMRRHYCQIRYAANYIAGVIWISIMEKKIAWLINHVNRSGGNYNLCWLLRWTERCG